jgi:hypothetical protein
MGSPATDKYCGPGLVPVLPNWRPSGTSKGYSYAQAGCFWLDRSLEVSWYEADQNGTAALPNASQALCWLNAIGGIFQSPADYALIGVDPQGNRTLNAGPNSNAQVACVNLQLN